MAHPLITLDPDQVRDLPVDASLPAWARTLVEHVRQAASSGQTVTVTAEERMLTPGQMAARMNMSRSTVSRRIAAGEIQAIKVGNRHRIPYTEFLRFREAVLTEIAVTAGPDVEAELFGDE
ncbi:MAG: helix-turn-helix domain-containing protein [Micrococcales bacterium]|nr:helix-turn-helix domain-containing protein [Micrococcales bacterium]